MAKQHLSNRHNPSSDSPAVAIKPTLSPDELVGISIDELFEHLNSSPQGLNSEQADERLKIYGRNELAGEPKHSIIKDFLLHFKSPLVIILLFAAVISGLLQEIVNMSIILVIIFASVALDSYQESKAGKAAELLKQKVTTTATVLRDGVRQEIGLPEIVPGDVIYLSAGDILPADARVILAKDLFVNQSSLTGESFPVEKVAGSVKKGGSLVDWSNFCFMGTSVVSGSATAVVVKTGSATEYGKIAKKLVEKAPETEFERGIKSFGFFIMQLTFLFVVFVFLVIALRNPTERGVVSALLFSVALAVGLTPELLPMIITINLSRGAMAMSKKGVIVKRLSAIENFGSMNVLCTDKTGTLTDNRIKLILNVNIDGNEDDKVFLHSFLNSNFQTGLRSPLDEAILKHKEIDTSKYQKIDEVPFDFIRRRVSVVVEHEGQRYFTAKGAPEEILRVCSYFELGDCIADLNEEIRQKIEQKYHDYSAQGLRVLGIAYKRLKEDKAVYSINDENDMIFLGFVAFLDPPKETAKQSIHLLSRAGIELKVLTGDNELVTRRVCEELGFEIKGVALGSDIANLTDDALMAIVEEANIFCRVNPVQKDRIITLLKKNGHVVGYMGDGINDAPSLKTCDVGISVDNAVDVARESADIILSKNDLTVLAEGVLEGRKTFGNTMKYIQLGVSSNFGNMFSVAGAALFLSFLPMLPVQILLNNLLYDFSQTTITTDKVDNEYLERPKRWDISFIRRFMVSLGPVSSLFDFLTFFSMLLIFIPFIPLAMTTADPDYSVRMFQTAWFIESIVSQVLVVFVIRTRRTPFWKSKPSKYLMISSIIIIAFALLLPFSPLGRIFGFEAPSLMFYAFLALLMGAYLLVAELVKSWFYKRNAYRLEQVLVPKRAYYLTRNAKLMQDMIAVISLRDEEEFTISSLTDDLNIILSYPINFNQVARNLQYLRRSNLISVDWTQRTVKRERALSDYVGNSIIMGPNWATVGEEWRKISVIIQNKHGAVNAEFTELLPNQ
ncbi:MAG: magnesium-translocating P-type ATPase [Nitrososphaerota archaeon]|jgi:Mg2+-importing ATPase|uniref:magnesium-translocating P-type ATPase n=1 Tax=Candidatus Bathycorpusculum sp. TaxID=2994959 RepID=UPI002828CE92|nr:magnesium-translocating P-type ATPase [Candidatus Termitimicrobium sp.]MCL2432156.1 magnesium-translocating P-type ATPase [Candidatus Termitimicrobium sp.]MDR0493557.1 magnesium-translocating P-type ATPase [Nitrososphaerota archaeon]